MEKATRTLETVGALTLCFNWICLRATWPTADDNEDRVIRPQTIYFELNWSVKKHVKDNKHVKSEIPARADVGLAHWSALRSNRAVNSKVTQDDLLSILSTLYTPRSLIDVNIGSYCKSTWNLSNRYLLYMCIVYWTLGYIILLKPTRICMVNFNCLT